MKQCEECDYKKNRTPGWCYKYDQEPESCLQFRQKPLGKRSDDTNDRTES